MNDLYAQCDKLWQQLEHLPAGVLLADDFRRSHIGRLEYGLKNNGGTLMHRAVYTDGSGKDYFVLMAGGDGIKIYQDPTAHGYAANVFVTVRGSEAEARAFLEKHLVA